MSDWGLTTILVLARVAALVAIVPGLSSAVVPWRARLLVVALVTWPVLCVIPVANQDALAQNSTISLVVHELVVGVSLGLVPAAIAFGLQVAVQSLQGMTGLPGGSESTEGQNAAPLQRLFHIVVLATFFLSSGHRLVVESLLGSFRWLPPGSHTSLASNREVLLDLLAASFELGVQAMSPIAVSLAFGLLVLAAINRIVPHVGYFAVGMSVQTTVLFGALMICVGAVVWLLESGIAAGPDLTRFAWQDVLAAIAGP